MDEDAKEMARRIQAVIDMHEFGTEMMRGRLVAAHGPEVGEKKLRQWLAADGRQGPGRPSDRSIETP